MEKLEFGLPSDPNGWNSWSAMKGRRRQAVRLSASVDSLPCAENDFFSSSGSFTNYPPDYEEDGSVNNILDAFGERVTTTSGSTSSGHGHRLSGAVSWSVLDSEPSRNLMLPQEFPGTVITPPPLIHPSRAAAVLKGDESSGVGTDTLSSISPTGSSTASANRKSSSPAHRGGSNLGTATRASGNGNEPEDYEHVYCQLDPYFSPPLSIAKSQPIVSLGSTRFTPRASLRSWGRTTWNTTTGTMDKDLGVIPFLQQALALRYREMLDTYLEPPQWYRKHMGSTDLEEICPVLYHILPPEKVHNPIYGLFTSKKMCTGEHSVHQSFQPILPHQIFAKPNEEDQQTRSAWLEGDPGSGKTLLCLKFIQEWVSHASYNYTNTQLNAQMGEFSLLLYIPLREVKGSLTRFINTELITKRSVLSRIKCGSLFKFLEKLTNANFLIIFDGVEDLTEGSILTEVQDIMNGITFPQATVLLTSRSKMSSDDKRRFLVNGMEWAQIQSTVGRYFTGGKFGNETRLVEILAERHDLALLASNPFMCLLLCFVFEEVGDIPLTDSEFYGSLLKSLIHQNGLIKSDSSPSKSIIPSKWSKTFEDLGKLALGKLSERRSEYTESEVMDACGSLDVLKTGILIRTPGFFLKSNRKHGLSSLGILHPAMNIFLAANYLATRINYPNILRRELNLLPGFVELIEPSVQNGNLAYNVLQLTMELLQKKSATILSMLSLLDVSVNYLLAFLRSSGFFESNLSSVCSTLRSMKHVTIHVNSEWASEWKQVMSNPNCPFESMEILIRPGCSLSRLVEGLCLNETVNSVKISSVPGQDWSHVEVNLVSGQLLRLLSEKKLKCLEISMTCLEDKEHVRFQGIIDVLCFILSRNVPLMKLVLDMDLTSAQIEQLVSYIKDHETLDILHLPHLGCGPHGFANIANLLYAKSFLSLSLAGSWRSTHSDEELGVVMEPLPPMSPFSLKQVPFSSLPRAVKSPSIRRKRLPGALLVESEKRNSDSVLFQRNFLPVPICDKENHEVDGFHGIFSSLRDPRNYSNLRSLNLSKCVMNWEDVICLGETIRKTKCLDSLRMEGMKLCDVLPILLGLQENVSLKLLDLSSPHVVIGDDALQLVSTSLSKNQTLRLLSIQGWTCYIEEERSLETLQSLLRLSKVQDLDLSGVRIHINSSSLSKRQHTDTLNSNSSMQKKDLTLERSLLKNKSQGLGSILSLSSASQSQSSNRNPHFPGFHLPASLSFLRIGGLSVEMSKSQTLKPYDLLPFLEENYKLTHLDISLDKNDSTAWTEEKILLKTLKFLSSHIPKLKTLVMQNWRVKLSTEKSTCKEIGKYLQSCQYLSEVNVDNSTILSAETSRRLDGAYAQAFLSSLKSLSEFSWANYEISQIPVLINSLDQFPSSDLTIKLDHTPLGSLKGFLSAKTTATVQYVGNHSILIRRSKERNETFMNKLKRLI